MTFTFDLATWFNISAYLLSTSSIYMKYEPNRPKQRVQYICFKKDQFAWSDKTLTIDLHLSFEITSQPLKKHPVGEA